MSSTRISKKLVNEIIREIDRRNKKKEMKIPISIFSTRKLTTFESLVMYMKDEVGHTYHEIAVMLQRDDRTIWSTYKRAVKKKGKT